VRSIRHRPPPLGCGTAGISTGHRGRGARADVAPHGAGLGCRGLGVLL